MEDILAGIEGFYPKAYIVERMLVKELEGIASLVIIVQRLSNLVACNMKVRNLKETVPTAVALTPVMQPTTEKGKGAMESLPNTTMLNFIIWNTQGANSAIFRRYCEALVKTHKPALLVLLETKMTDHKNVTDALKFDTFVQSPVAGMLRGFMIMWKEDIVKLDSISVTPQGIHTLIEVSPLNFSWYFSAVYASPNFNTRISLWNDLYTLSKSCINDWLVAGDFNEVLFANKKLRGNAINRNRAKLF